MMLENFGMPLLGGIIIGIAVSLMLFLNGRVTGVSGIVSGTLSARRGDFWWRLLFIIGLILGGFVLKVIVPETISTGIGRDLSVLIVAGLLVGFGTVMGNGCTSGHGICGLSRLSFRSLISTLTFMGFGILSATLFRLLYLGNSQ